ncbi:hypothetical protein N7539_007055 [Penicillium diatomitis]|uniref:Rhodopsin domain-containing protein n=1 Tax=Penicillium diatomitis TaxID=2819901 RepID=A0A9X0BSZ7_9EURO|nr:uncharacterized protein N7539_007055 [Penicillium diatomitis]KAJ5481161.1 hypothetical protein N7539_007055 [Penicillium diatomitis]
MQLPPKAIMATWPKPNYVNSESRGHGVAYVNAIFTFLALVVVMLRMYARAWITYSVGVDDWLIFAALIFTIGMVAVTTLATESWGWDRHVWDVPVVWLSTVQKLNVSFQILYSQATSLTKISILWFCRRLLGAGKKGGMQVYNWIFIIAMFVAFMANVLFTITSIFQCSPVKAYWTVDPQFKHHCLNEGNVLFAASVINLFTDFMTTAVPMPLIWRLKLPVRQRLAVMSIFGLGVLVTVAGSFRTAFVWQSMVVGYDRTWLSWPILITASIEINIGLICACAPALRPLVVKWFPRLDSSKGNSSYDPKARSGSSKPWLSTARSHKMIKNPDASIMAVTNVGYEDDQEGIMRTVELEAWSTKQGQLTGHTYEIPPADRSRSPSSLEAKDDIIVYSSACSGQSSGVLGRDDTRRVRAWS